MQAPFHPMYLELDARIAKEIFELQVLGFAACYRDPECSGYYLPYDEIADGDWAIRRPIYLIDCACKISREPSDIDYFGHCASCLGIVADYSAGIVAAWQVIERLKECGFTVYLFDQLGYDFETEEGDLWRIGFKDEAAYEADDDRPRCEVWLPTGEAKIAPFAICLAALETATQGRGSKTVIEGREEALADAYENEAIIISIEELEAIYDDDVFEAMELQEGLLSREQCQK